MFIENIPFDRFFEFLGASILKTGKTLFAIFHHFHASLVWKISFLKAILIWILSV